MYLSVDDFPRKRSHSLRVSGEKASLLYIVPMECTRFRCWIVGRNGLCGGLSRLHMHITHLGFALVRRKRVVGSYQGCRRFRPRGAAGAHQPATTSELTSAERELSKEVCKKQATTKLSACTSTRRTATNGDTAVKCVQDSTTATVDLTY